MYREECTSLNLNHGRPGRRRTVRSEENIANVRQLLHDDAHVTGRINKKKYREEDTSLNLNLARPRRRRTARSEKNTANVRQLLHDDSHVTGRINSLQISQVNFQRICFGSLSC